MRSYAPVLLIAVLALTMGLAPHQAQQPAGSQPAAPQAPPATGPAAKTPPCGPNLPSDLKNVDRQSRCFELRTYTVRPGSSMDTLHKRFREHTTRLFQKHGITIVGY